MINSEEKGLWYLQIYRSNFFADRRILRFNKELRSVNFEDGLFLYLELCMTAIEENKSYVEYDLEFLDICTGYNDTRKTSGYVQLLIKCGLAKIINNNLELYIAHSSIVSKNRYKIRQEEIKKRREKAKTKIKTPESESGIDKLNDIPF